MRRIGGASGRTRAVLFLGWAVAGALGAAPSGGAATVRLPAAGKTYTWSFEADTLGQKPAHSMAFGGVWQVSEDSTGSASPASRILSQSEDDDGITWHYLTFTRPLLGDLDASVRFRIRSGEIDPSAGLLFQMDPKGTSGYLVRVSAKTGELAFHYLLYGKRRDVKFAKIGPIEPGTWHTLAISRRKSVTRASYDGKEVLRLRDDRFSQGNVGVWTEDDTLVDFADLTATAR
ncbi:MAG: hypothetical protein E6K76_05510 [Candidatus Eisenbacteria bacterium]|uniref:DUF1080 domain-containing protein n=1 Tax=Eiseniibacteriota bacterium TaxID=2212470 RepID=A0A538T6B2_UNCEI|nr:MAG: hypothetical protein E6K76_05510 [Candidatus Eisenbacteria bacterium]